MLLLVAVAGKAGAGMDEPIIHGQKARKPPAAQFFFSCIEGGRGSRSRAVVGGRGGGGEQPLFGLELLLLALRLLDLVLEREKMR